MFWLFLLLRSLTAVGNAVVMALAPPLFADYFDGLDYALPRGDQETEKITGSGRGYSLMFFFMTLPIGAYVIFYSFGVSRQKHFQK